jgi:hypothetical protein
MTQHSCPFCFKDFECESPQSKKLYKPYKEPKPEGEVMSGEDWKKLREALKK